MNPRLYEELAYCVPLGIPHSRFLDWSEDDQDKALAWTREQGKVCSGCGTRMEVWEKDRFAYVAESHTCPGCELLAQENRNTPAGREGVKTYLVPLALASEVTDPGDIESTRSAPPAPPPEDRGMLS